MTETITAAEWRSRKRTREKKYRNKITFVGDARFDSQAEARRYVALREREARGEIRNLRRQVPFELAKSVRLAGDTKAKPAMKIIIDFVYFEGNSTVLEDVKSPATASTAIWRAKLHLLKSIYGHDVRVVR